MAALRLGHAAKALKIKAAYEMHDSSARVASHHIEPSESLMLFLQSLRLVLNRSLSRAALF